MPLNSVIKKVSKLDQIDIKEMYELHSRFFLNVVYEQFVNDTKEKDLVIIERTKENKLAAFSTVQFIEMCIDNKKTIFVYSGNTIVDKLFWQSSSLAGCFAHILDHVMVKHKNFNCYWILTTKGFRTYRFLPVFCNSFYPIFNASTPLNYKKLMDEFCVSKFKNNYDYGKGLLIYNGQRDFLNEDMAQIESNRLKDPHICFFKKKNPEYYLGNELVCIADILSNNFNSRFMRILNRTKVKWDE